MDCTIYVVKTKTQISCTVTSQLICAFVFAYAKSRFPHDAAHKFVCELSVFLTHPLVTILMVVQSLGNTSGCTSSWNTRNILLRNA